MLNLIWYEHDRRKNKCYTDQRQTAKRANSFSVQMVKQQQRPAIYGELELSNIALS